MLKCLYIILLFILIIILFIYKKYKIELFNNNTLFGVPKIIYQTFPTKNIPNIIKKNINKLKKMNPDWKYVLFDDNDIVNFIKKEYGDEILKVYNKINPEYGPAKSDLFRYLLLYKKGGVYLDIKSNFKKPLKHIIKEDIFYLSHWKYKGSNFRFLKNKYGEFIQFIIISKPKHPYLKNVIKNVIKNINNYSIEKDGVGKYGVLKLTGPIVYTTSIMEVLNTEKHKIFNNINQSNFIYNNIKINHKKIFKNHYSKLKSKIVF